MISTKYTQLLLLAASLTLSGGISAQQLTPAVVATAGATFSNEEVTVEWTLGEVMTETYSNEGTLTQGFHQPRTWLLSSNPDLPTADHGEMTVYPNPAANYLRVLLPKEATLLGLVDVAGRVIGLDFAGDNGHYSAQLTDLPAGVYFLRAQLASGHLLVRRVVRR